MKKEGWILIGCFFVLSLMTTYSNCGMHLVPEATKQNTAEQTSNNPDQSITDTFTQPSQAQTQNKPEVVFVIDTSGSMSSKVEEIKTAITGWIDQLALQGVQDFCLGTMRGNTTEAGLLVAADGNQKCYCTFGADAVSSQMAAEKIGQNMDEVLQITTGGGADETTMLSLHKALHDSAILSQNQADGCFRSDTTLVPVLVGDENDAGAAPDGFGFVFDQAHLLDPGEQFSSVRGDPLYNKGGSGEEAVRKNFYCRDEMGQAVENAQGEYVNQIDHQTLFQDVQDFNGSYPSFGTAIGFAPDNLPALGMGQAEPFWGGMQFAQMFQTDLVDMRDAVEGNQSAFQNHMNAMADALATEILYFDTFDLTQPICDTDEDGQYLDEELSVSVNDQPVASDQFEISDEGDQILFDTTFSWTPADQIAVVYRPCL